MVRSAQLSWVCLGGIILHTMSKIHIKNIEKTSTIKDSQGNNLVISYDDGSANVTGDAQDAITIQDSVGRMIYANELAAKIMRLSSVEELLNITLPQLMTRYDVLEENGDPIPFEKAPGNLGLRGVETKGKILKVIVKDTGEEIYTYVRVVPIFDDERNVKMVFKVMREITARKKNEQKLAILAEAGNILVGSIDYKKTLRNLGNFIVPKFADWCLVHLVEDEYVNCVAISNVNAEKAKFAFELERKIPLDSKVRFGIPKVIRTRESEFYPEVTSELLESLTKNKNYLEVIKNWNLKSAMVIPLIARDKIIGTMSFLITDSNYHYTNDDLIFAEQLGSRAALAIDNSRLYDQLKVLDKAKDEFLAMLSHELRNPLAPILNSVQLLKAGVGPEESKELIDITERQVENMRRLVDDLLNTSRIMQGKINLQVKPMDIILTVNNAIKTATPHIESKGHKLNLSSNIKSLEILGDAIRIEQVLVNLLVNAAKYTDKRGDIRISCLKEDGNISIKIKDNGIGITKDMLPKIFDIFTQVDKSLARTQGGIGVGLAFSKAVVELHGGTITAYSEGVRKGSEFTVSLPVKI